MRTGFYYDPIYLKHDTGQHPENFQRLSSIHEKLEIAEALKDFEVHAAKRAHTKDIELVHSKSYISLVEAATYEGRRYFGTMDCAMSEDTYEVALHAVGAVLDAVVEVSEQRLDNAFCAVRPPGHHAEFDQAMGFCFFNNIAVAAEFLVKELGYQKVLVFDFDVHHGNGTQHLFEERSDIFYASIHQDPRTCYPGTGFSKETGKSGGTGYTLNVPMAPYSEDHQYKAAFQQNLLPVFEEYKPDFVLLSSGFDAHIHDPLATMNVTEKGFNYMTEAMKNLADRFAEGRLVSILEGGYHLDALSNCVLEHMKLLKSGDTKVPESTIKDRLKQFFGKSESRTYKHNSEF